MSWPLASDAATAAGEIEVLSPKAHSRARQPDLSDIVVWLEPTKPHPVRSSETPHARLLQKNKSFIPHVLVIQVGTVVDFPNADPIFHSAFSNFNGQIFDLGLYPPGTTKSVVFRRPGIVRVFCNIHPTMSAFIVVLDTPYYTGAKRDGEFQISDLPPGDYELHAFDERATGNLPDRIHVAVSAEESRLQLPTLKISEEGYQPLPHKNKYGLDYPSDKTIDVYGGVPK
jgi:plastocyanin